MNRANRQIRRFVLFAIPLLVGILFSAGLCAAAPRETHPIRNFFETHSTPADDAYRLSPLVLKVTGIIFAVVSALLVIIRFRSKSGMRTHEPPHVYGSAQIELAWTVMPVLVVIILFLATARDAARGIAQPPAPGHP
jgi:cytochrome c oxidase subunit 2